MFAQISWDNLTRKVLCTDELSLTKAFDMMMIRSAVRNCCGQQLTVKLFKSI